MGDPARPPVRGQQDHVDPQSIAVPGKATGKDFRRPRHPPQTIRIHGKVKIGSARAPLHLDKGDNAAASRHNIDFASPYPQAAPQNAPPGKSEPPYRQRFTTTSALFGLGSPRLAHLRASALA